MSGRRKISACTLIFIDGAVLEPRPRGRSIHSATGPGIRSYLWVELFLPSNMFRLWTWKADRLPWNHHLNIQTTCLAWDYHGCRVEMSSPESHNYIVLSFFGSGFFFIFTKNPNHVGTNVLAIISARVFPCGSSRFILEVMLHAWITFLMSNYVANFNRNEL